MPRHSPMELSLRHLPDLSASDCSFQIPLADTSDLLANDDDDFFHGADDSLRTPMLPRITHDPLTLSQLTPKLRHQPTSLNPLPPTSLARAVNPAETSQVPTVEPITGHIEGLGKAAVIKSALKPIELCGPSGIFESLKTEVETLINDPINTLPVKKTLVTRRGARGNPPIKPTVVNGRISKQPKNISLLQSESLPSAPLSRPAEVIVREAEIDEMQPSHSPDPDQSYANTSTGSVGQIASNGVAERLLMYSQKFMPSLGLLNSQSASETISRDSSPDPRHSSQADAPLTLSQVSPRKPNSGQMSTHENPVATSPMRPPTKRPISRTTTSSHQPKKGKMMSVPASILQPSVKKNASAVVNANLGGLGKQRVRTSRRAARNEKGKERAICSSAGSGSQATHCRVKVPRDVHLNSEASSEHQAASQHSQPVKAGHMPQSRTSDVTLPPAQIRPNQLDSQVSSRKVDSEDKTSRKMPNHAPPVPDFKALHASQGVQAALRKEQIAPIYPLPIELNTESRAKEREKFDEMIKVKNREAQRALEQRKQEREAEEEREIREARKKAVPKAHEVPEWYKEAPRRKDNRERLDIVG